MRSYRSRNFMKHSSIYASSLIVLFIFIGLLTTVKPAYRISSDVISKLTSDIDSTAFLYLLSVENRGFQQFYPDDKKIPSVFSIIFQMMTNIQTNDPRSLLAKEVPGLPPFDTRLIIAGEGMNQANISIESSPPLEEVLKERRAVVHRDEEEKDYEKSSEEKSADMPTTGDRKVVFIYNTHNRESFLPHLPDVTDPNSAHHHEVNITKVSEKFAEALEARGIGTKVNNTDHMGILNERGWTYGQSYQASREVVEAAVHENKDIQYIFDIHRDSATRENSTMVINDQPYARILFVVGAEHDQYEKNLEIAWTLHELVEEKYPGLSRGVIEKQGPGNNGIYNQDLSENAVLLEMGGYENTLDELYRTADAVAEVFSEWYWKAEMVQGNE